MSSRIPFFLISALFYLGIPLLSFPLLARCSKRPRIGLMACVLFCFFAATALPHAAEQVWREQAERFLRSHTLWVGSIAAFGALATFASVGSYVSLLMSRRWPGSYVIEGGGGYLGFVSAYVWHFFEVTRVIKVGTTFGVDKPGIRPTSWLGGMPILAFKLITLAIALVLLATIWTVALDRYRGQVMGSGGGV